MWQIRLSPNGLWHRRARDDPRHTACGIEIIGTVASREASRIGNHLCPICWTGYEIDTGELKRLEAEVLKREEAEAQFADEEPTNPNSKDDS